MAITTISGKQKDNNHGGYDMYSQVFTDIDNSYDWIKTVRSSDGYTDDCYITDNLYLRLAGENIGRTYAKFNVIVCGTFGTKTLYSRDLTNMYVTWCFTKTSKGFAFQLSSSSSGYDDNLDYKFYVGEITKLDGTTAQGCIYSDDNGNLTIATDEGISEENAIGSTINADRKILGFESPLVRPASFNSVVCSIIFHAPLNLLMQVFFRKGKCPVRQRP